MPTLLPLSKSCLRTGPPCAGNLHLDIGKKKKKTNGIFPRMSSQPATQHLRMGWLSTMSHQSHLFIFHIPLQYFYTSQGFLSVFWYHKYLFYTQEWEYGHLETPFRKREWKSLSRVWLCATPWTVAHQAPLSMGFSRQECKSGLPFPSLGDLPNSGIKPSSPALQADSSPSEPLSLVGPCNVGKCFSGGHRHHLRLSWWSILLTPKKSQKGHSGVWVLLVNVWVLKFKVRGRDRIFLMALKACILNKGDIILKEVKIDSPGAKNLSSYKLYDPPKCNLTQQNLIP